jgi:hypothetical protein
MTHSSYQLSSEPFTVVHFFDPLRVTRVDTNNECWPALALLLTS